MKNRNIFSRNFFCCRKKVVIWSGHHEHILGWHCWIRTPSLTRSLAGSAVPHNEFIYFIGPKAIWWRVFVSVFALELIKIIWWRKSTVSSVCFVHRWARTARMTFATEIPFDSIRIIECAESAKASEQRVTRIFLGPVAILTTLTQCIFLFLVTTWVCFGFFRIFSFHLLISFVCWDTHSNGIACTAVRMFYSFQMLYISYAAVYKSACFSV